MSNAINGTALITGASSGIGAIYADRLASQGYNLILVARSKDKLCNLARKISDKTGRLVEVLQADLAEPADLRRIEEVLRTDQSITMLVNNAGVGATAPLLDSKVAAMDAMIALNGTVRANAPLVKEARVGGAACLVPVYPLRRSATSIPRPR